MHFREQNGFGEERAGREEKREPFGSAQGKQGPALQTQLSTRISVSQMRELSRAIFRFDCAFNKINDLAGLGGRYFSQDWREAGFQASF